MKTKSKHTPGPDELRWVPSTGGGANLKDGHGNVALARIYETPGWESRAALWLAAPDLLASAKRALAMIEAIPHDAGWRPIAELRAAIAKAGDPVR